MSKPRYPWWGYIREILKRYPNHLTAREKAAIDSALFKTGNMELGNLRVKVIDLVFFREINTLSGAALQVPCDYETAKRWQQQFIRLVAEELGLVENEKE